MPLRFEKDAICLSGLNGTKLKSKIIGDYYRIWWEITSGGKYKDFPYPVSIIEMNAGTGEVFIEETEEIILGSAGHALKLKYANWQKRNPKLDVILVEEDDECVSHLINVIRRRFPDAEINLDSNDSQKDKKEIVLIRNNIDEALDAINQMNLSRRSIYFFDPLLSVEFDFIHEVYINRCDPPLSEGTEFLIFFFTSDWVLGRKNFSKLPMGPDQRRWSDDEISTVEKLNFVYGDDGWQDLVLNEQDLDEKMEKIVNYYQEKLFNLFRFVIPMPFSPNPNQIYHLFFCTNHTAGSSILTQLYRKNTGNIWKPSNRKCYELFKKRFSRDISFPTGRSRPDEWKLLWALIKGYVYGIIDAECAELVKNYSGYRHLNDLLNWLELQGFLKEFHHENEEIHQKRYELNWSTIFKILKLKKPHPLIPLTDQDFAD